MCTSESLLVSAKVGKGDAFGRNTYSEGAKAETWDRCRILKIPRELLDTQTCAISYAAFYSHKLMRTVKSQCMYTWNVALQNVECNCKSGLMLCLHTSSRHCRVVNDDISTYAGRY